MNKLAFIFIAVFTMLIITSKPAAAQSAVGKWERAEINLSTSGCGSTETDKYKVYFDGVFTHSGSGAQIVMPGYYNGSNTFTVGFMPTKTGTWNYTTTSSKPAGVSSSFTTCASLAGQSGSISVSESGLPGMLTAAASNSKKWKFTDGDYVVPIALRSDHFIEPASQSVFNSVANLLANNNATMLETRLLDEYARWENGRTDYIFNPGCTNNTLTGCTADETVWDRFDDRMDALSALGLGSHIMFYSDDAGKPKWGAKSFTEEFVIRYSVARTAGYPVVWYNTGIDIAEYRTESDIDWFGDKLAFFDPYDHPRSSRHGGGSGNIIMNAQNYDSLGSPSQAKVVSMISLFETTAIPVSYDDAWGENRASHPTKNHTEQDIRRAFWKAMVAGGVGGLIRGGATAGCFNGMYCLTNFAAEWESEQWLKHVNPFLATYLGDTFGQMNPDTSVVSGGKVYAISDSAKTKILYFAIGSNDTYEGNNGGGPVTVKLTGLTGTYSAFWFDTRSGNPQTTFTLAAGQDHVLTPPAPSNDDWVLLLTKSGGTGTPIPTVFPTATPTTPPGNTPTPTNAPTPSPTPLPGDANGDNKVDGLDYIIWLINYNTTTLSGPIKGDFNNDKNVDGLDYVIWLNNYGS